MTVRKLDPFWGAPRADEVLDFAVAVHRGGGGGSAGRRHNRRRRRPRLRYINPPQPRLNPPRPMIPVRGAPVGISLPPGTGIVGPIAIEPEIPPPEGEPHWDDKEEWPTDPRLDLDPKDLEPPWDPNLPDPDETDYWAPPEPDPPDPPRGGGGGGGGG